MIRFSKNCIALIGHKTTTADNEAASHPTLDTSHSHPLMEGGGILSVSRDTRTLMLAAFKPLTKHTFLCHYSCHIQKRCLIEDKTWIYIVQVLKM